MADCPTCSTKNEAHDLVDIDLDTRHASLRKCASCGEIFQETAKGDLVPLGGILQKIRLGDDLAYGAASPTTTVGESIQTLFDRFRGASTDLWLQFAGASSTMLQQVETRAHFLMGELARRAMADSGLDPLLETAKQIKDLVSSHPDGIPRTAGNEH